MSPKELPPKGVFQSSLNEKGIGTFGTTTEKPPARKLLGDARDEIFYQPARTVPIERPVKTEVDPQKLPFIARLTRTLGSVALAGGIGLSVQHHIEAQEELSVPGVTRDIGAVPQTAVKDYHLILQKAGLEVIVPPVFDTKASEIIVKAGVNAKAATPQQIREFLSRTPPVFEKPKVGEYAPTIQILMPVNPKNAKEVKIIQKLFDIKKDNPSSVYYYSSTQPNFYISGDAPFNLPLPLGAKTVEMKVSVNPYRINSIESIYTLNDGQRVRGQLNFWDNNYVPTDILKNLPTYNPNIIKDTLKEAATPTQKFDLTENPSIPLFRPSGSTQVNLAFTRYQSPLDQSALSAVFETDNGQALY